MKFDLVRVNEKEYILCFPDGRAIATEADVLDCVAACGEHLCHRLLILAGCIPDEFYDLKTGLAGTALLKLGNYRITTVFQVAPEKVGNGRFYEMMLETNRGKEFHFCIDQVEAEAWLQTV